MTGALTIDMATLIPKVRAAFDAGELQCQTEAGRGASCRYSGPCAVGIGFDPDVRQQLDEPATFRSFGSPGVRTLVRNSAIQVLPAGAGTLGDLSTLQGFHDGACTLIDEDYPQALAAFETFLQEMEARYVRAA